MEETLEGGRGPPRAVVPLGINGSRTVRCFFVSHLLQKFKTAEFYFTYFVNKSPFFIFLIISLFLSVLFIRKQCEYVILNFLIK